MQRIIRSRQNSGCMGKTYLYRFAVDSPTQNYYRISHFGHETRGVCHADELSYLFKNIHIDVPERDSMEFKAIHRIVSLFLHDQRRKLMKMFSQVSLFTSFAKSGNPNDNVINAEFQGVLWQSVDTLEPPFYCLNIGENLEFKKFPESERLTIWDEIYLQTNTPLY
jgi:carboxylesterase type B